MSKPINQMSLEELAEYAVTLDAWEWMPGMLGYRGGSVWVRIISNTQRAIRPDLSDPATLGCVLAMVRARHGRRTFVHASMGLLDFWCVVCRSPKISPQPYATHQVKWTIDGYPTEAHALIAALAMEAS